MKRKILTIVSITSICIICMANIDNPILLKSWVDPPLDKGTFPIVQNKHLSTTIGVRSVYPGTQNKLIKIWVYKKNPFTFYNEIGQHEIDLNSFPLFYIDTTNWPSGDYHLVMIYEGNGILHDDVTI